MKSEIHEICGDYALDIDNFDGGKTTIYFNSRRNALNVKRILEVDDSIPNAATVCDMREVVRCKDCKYFQDRYIELPDGSKRAYKKGENSVSISIGINIGSHCTRIDYAIVHGYRDGEPSVDKTRLWVQPDDFCSYGERKDGE